MWQNNEIIFHILYTHKIKVNLHYDFFARSYYVHKLKKEKRKINLDDLEISNANIKKYILFLPNILKM